MLIVVDGRSGAGKTTFANRVVHLFEGGEAALVHTDDIAWHLDFFDWDDLLLEQVVGPWRRREPVRYVPPGWARMGREGAVEVAPVRVLVVEGVGAGRPSLARAAEVVVWVQSDRDEARSRGLARDVELGRTRAEAEQFWDEWMDAEEPFQAASRPWSRAHLIARGTTAEPLEPGWCHVAAGPLP